MNAPEGELVVLAVGLSGVKAAVDFREEVVRRGEPLAQQLDKALGRASVEAARFGVHLDRGQFLEDGHDDVTARRYRKAAGQQLPVVRQKLRRLQDLRARRTGPPTALVRHADEPVPADEFGLGGGGPLGQDIDRHDGQYQEGGERQRATAMCGHGLLLRVFSIEDST